MKNQKDLTDKKDMEKRFDKKFPFHKIITPLNRKETLSFIRQEIQSAIHKTEKRKWKEIMCPMCNTRHAILKDAIQSSVAETKAEIREKVEGLQKVHTHNSIPSLTANIDEGCSYCLRNAHLSEVLKLLD